MSFQWFFVAGVNPEPWEAPTVSVGRKNGKFFPQFHKSAQLRNYQEALKEEFVAQNPHYVEHDGDIELFLFFWRKVASYDTLHGRRQRANYADVTNLQKSTEDALQRLLYSNDRWIKYTCSILVDQSDDTEPGILIGIGPTSSDISVAATILRSILEQHDTHVPTLPVSDTEYF